MAPLTRRTFLGTSAACAVLGAGRLPPAVLADDGRGTQAATVHFRSDGLMLSPQEYADQLAKLAGNGQATADRYLASGCVAEMEARFAKLLGKERAVFVPTGTLANHLALRCQAGGKTRVLVQAESHIYRDSMDCVPTLSHLNLVPLAADKATIPLSEIEDAHQRAASGPFPLQVGVISLESPVRRRFGEVFDLKEMERIAAFARRHDIKMHLDGARLWLASAYTGVTPAEYARLFDTVYISLYKYFNAGTGAVLAGPPEVIEQVVHARKVFGGGLYQAWPYAAVALHYLDGFDHRYQKAVTTARALFARLQENPRFHVDLVPNGSNVVRLHVKDADARKYRAALESRGVGVNAPSDGGSVFVLVVNESANRRPADELARIFIEALPEGK
jgi:threonine aldolase